MEVAELLIRVELRLPGLLEIKYVEIQEDTPAIQKNTNHLGLIFRRFHIISPEYFAA